MPLDLNHHNPYAGTLVSGRIPSLDGIRGMAIIMVILGHGAYSYPLPSFLEPLANGRLGVKVFFVLSGYLIYNLTFRELRVTGTFDWRHFYVRRVLRIFPCFYFYFLIITGLVLSGRYVIPWPMLFGAGTFSLNYRHLWDVWSASPNDYYVIGQYWTLALEEQFYLLWPLLVVFIRRGSLQGLLMIAIACAPLIRILCYFVMPASRGQLMMMAHTGYDAIAFGVLLGELMMRSRSRMILTSAATNSWLFWLCLIVLFVFSPFMGRQFQGAYAVTFGATLDLLAISVLILVAVTRVDTAFFRILNCRPLMFIGTLSYSLYIWNPLFLYSNSPIAFNHAPLNFALVFAAGLLSHYAIERPFLRVKDRIGKPRQPLTPLDSAS